MHARHAFGQLLRGLRPTGTTRHGIQKYGYGLNVFVPARVPLSLSLSSCLSLSLALSLSLSVSPSLSLYIYIYICVCERIDQGTSTANDRQGASTHANTCSAIVTDPAQRVQSRMRTATHDVFVQNLHLACSTSCACARGTYSFDTCGIRSRAGRPNWLSRPTP